MPKLELSQLLRPTTTPEQLNFLSQFYGLFDSNVGLHKQILNVEPLFYMGVGAGTEFLVYDATKLYIAYHLEFSMTNPLSFAYIHSRFYNEVNARSMFLSLETGYYDPVAGFVKYLTNNPVIKNIYFSRFELEVFNYIIFNGYRITLN
jgi:hypothetical protein